jgi:hypothetical protein
MASSKIWKVQQDSESMAKITGESVSIIGAPNRFIKVNKNGTTVYGPMSVVAGSESIKTGGMFSSLPDLLQMIPSTTFSPIPSKIPMPPLGVAFDLAADVAFFAILLG